MALVGLYFAFLFIGGHIIMSTRLLALSLRTQFGVVDPTPDASASLLKTAEEFEEAADAYSIGGCEAPELVNSDSEGSEAPKAEAKDEDNLFGR